MRALLHDFPMVYHGDGVGVLNGRQSVGDDDAGATLLSLVQGLLYHL